jgi:hypothetical protein
VLVKGEYQRCGRHTGNMPRGAPRRGKMRTKKATKLVSRRSIHETRPPCRFGRRSYPGFAVQEPNLAKSNELAGRIIKVALGVHLKLAIRTFFLKSTSRSADRLANTPLQIVKNAENAALFADQQFKGFSPSCALITS